MNLLHKYLALSVLCIAGLACSLIAGPATPTAIPQASPTVLSPHTPTPAVDAGPSATPAGTEAASPSETPNPLSPSMPMPFMNLNGVSQYFNPSGQPVQDWNGIPIMPGATAGQEFKPRQVYSFKAGATIEQATKFYTSRLPALGYTSFMAGPATGSSGSGSNSMHDSFLYYTKDSQMILFYIASFDSDPGDVVVVISTQ